ncbi:NAD(P)-dependent oxidoreductase [Amantichitinum ursilacus]|uniref:3-hydroxyisobutyrate dehydrogenase n=1 Tax=Amantichitinum ursilacus TaxID=857265 RepID=A0A0N1JS10_9NEIS|nr:NAD(P)-dependent oxidoreductase [Amantichitinum ursilacus]KPC49971.1 3-hydroxyisobutyrate dehydrogenase [Amantichitinum ursilacus]
MKLALIGLGQMGAGIAANLLKAGHDVTVHNRSPGKAEALLEQGAHWAATPREAALGAEAVLSMVADDAALLGITQGDDGLLAGLAAGAVHVSMSTVSSALVEQLALGHEAAGVALVAAPVFGRPDVAAAGKLTVVAAGDAQAIEKVRPALEAIGQKLFEVGTQPQQAALIKLIGNFLISAVIEGLGEGAALAQKAGVDPARLIEVLTSTLFNAPVYHTYGNLIAQGQYRPAAFALPLGAKDNRLVLQAAEALNVPLPFASVVRDKFVQAQALGLGDADWSAIASVSATNAGL